jgi:hypothetical protein
MNWRTVLIDLLDVADKYFVVAGIAFLLVYVVLRKRIAWRKIQLRFPKDKDYRREIVDSTISIIIFALMPVLILRVPEIRVHIGESFALGGVCIWADRGFYGVADLSDHPVHGPRDGVARVYLLYFEHNL